MPQHYVFCPSLLLQQVVTGIACIPVSMVTSADDAAGSGSGASSTSGSKAVAESASPGRGASNEDTGGPAKKRNWFAAPRKAWAACSEVRIPPGLRTEAAPIL
jgi:hypothetical protein